MAVRLERDGPETEIVTVSGDEDADEIMSWMLREVCVELESPRVCTTALELELQRTRERNGDHEARTGGEPIEGESEGQEREVLFSVENEL